MSWHEKRKRFKFGPNYKSIQSNMAVPRGHLPQRVTRVTRMAYSPSLWLMELAGETKSTSVEN